MLLRVIPPNSFHTSNLTTRTATSRCERRKHLISQAYLQYSDNFLAFALLLAHSAFIPQSHCQEFAMSGTRKSPQITQKLTLHEAGDGSNLSIELRCTSHSEPQIAWLVNGAQVQDGGKYKLLFKKEGGADTYHASLTATGTSKQTASPTKYEVRLRNDAGKGKPHVRYSWTFDPSLKLFHAE